MLQLCSTLTSRHAIVPPSDSVEAPSRVVVKGIGSWKHHTLQGKEF